MFKMANSHCLKGAIVTVVDKASSMIFLVQGTRLYRTVQDKPLKDHLPLGTGVLVNLRR